MSAVTVAPEMDLRPEREAILAHLDHLFGQVPASADGLVEIAWAPRHSPASLSRAQLFPLDDLDAIADHIEQVGTLRGQRVYLSAGLRQSEAPPDRRASDADVSTVTALWADFDREGAAERARAIAEELAIPPTLVVQTGTVPHLRAHFWWRLEEPLPAGEAGVLLAQLAELLGGDPTVRNPSRLMRAAGSIAWPTKPGRELELVQLLPDWSICRPPYSVAEISRALGAHKPAATPALTTRRPRAQSLEASAYGRATLQGVCDEVAGTTAGEGQRNRVLNACAYRLGRAVGSGDIPFDDALSALLQAAEANGYVAKRGEQAVRQIIESGLSSGRSRPLETRRAPGELITLQPRSSSPPASRGSDDEAPTGPIGDYDEAFAPGGFAGELPPPRPWAYGDFLMHGAVTGIAAPPGTCKTTFAVQLGICFGLGLALGPWGPRPGGGGRAWLFNGEEPQEELDRRFLAACKEMSADEAEASERFAYSSGLTHGLTLLIQDRRTGTFTRSPHLQTIKRHIINGGFRLFIIDPLIEFHQVAENDAVAMRALGNVLREIATECACAVLVFHHTPKSASADTAAGDMNAMRGGGPLIGVARFVATMFTMSKSDAQNLGVPAKEAVHYVRFDGAKANMSPVPAEGVWWRKLGIGIDNADDVRPADQVAILRHVHLGARNELSDEDRTAASGSLRDRLSAEIIRVCELNGHTSPGSAAALDAICGAADQKRLGVSNRKAKDVIIGEFGPDSRWGGYRIIVTNLPRGAQTVRRIHVEPDEGGDQ